MFEGLLNIQLMPVEKDYTTLYLGIPWQQSDSGGPTTVHAAIARIGKANYVFGGFTTTAIRSSYRKYDQTLGATIAQLPKGLAGHTAVGCTGKAYIFGGFINNTAGSESKSCYIYDPSLNTYENLPDFPENFIYGHGAAIGTDIYLIGGVSSYAAAANPSASTAQNFWKFDTLTKTFTKLPWPTIPFRLAPGVVNIGNKLWVYGGRGGPTSNLFHSDISVYDPENETWTYITNQINPPAGRTCRNAIIALGNCFFVAGGQVSSSGNFYTATTAIYDTVNNTWITLANLPANWGWGTLMEVNNTIYLNQGIRGTGSGIGSSGVFQLKP